MPIIYWDTEDNAPELAASGRSGFEKVVTQIAAKTDTGEEFYLKPKITRKRKSNASDINRFKCDIKPFELWLKSFGPQVTAYAHNPQYDLGNLWPDKLDGFNVTMVGNRLISAVWENVRFLDSGNIWPMSLKKVGASVGLEKLEMDVNSAEYLWRDVDIVKKAMELADTLAARYGVPDLPATLGGLCVKVWQAMGGTNWHCSLPPARLAYYGGRVELFRPTAHGNIWYTDINSLYPSVMLHEFPDADNLWFDMRSLSEAQAALLNPRQKLFGVCDVTIEIPHWLFIAPLPVRREDDSIYYPVGTVSGWWTVAEIRRAIAKGCKLISLRECYGSTTGQAYYSEFVQTFYKLRQHEQDEGKKLFYKLLMNNLYGQLGMSGEVTRSVKLQKYTQTNVKGEKTLTREGTPYGTKLLTTIQMPLEKHVNWLHAAYVTSYGRLKLQEYLDAIPQHSLIYCDTDSVFFEHNGDKPPFSIGTELGQMKLEDRLTYCHCRGPKMYRIKDEKGKVKTKVKGIPARDTLPEQFFDSGQAEFLQPWKLRESIGYFDDLEANEIVDKTRVLSVWHTVTKRILTGYDKKRLHGPRFYPIVHTSTAD